MSKPGPTPKYAVGEKLLCFHGPLMYEAKCLDVKVKDDTVMYFVHYQGWNKNWDEWVTDRRMFKYNEEGLKKQKDLERQIKSGKKVKVLRKSELKMQSYPPPELLGNSERAPIPVEIKQGKKVTNIDISLEEDSPKSKQQRIDEVQKPEIPVPSEPNEVEIPKSINTNLDDISVATPSSAALPSRRRKGRNTSTLSQLENDEGFLNKPQLKVELAPSLKAWLVDDWDLITRQARLYELPAAHPISAVVTDFLESAETDVKMESTSELDLSSDSQNSQPPIVRVTADLRREFVAGIKHYFNLVVGSHLLYKFERLQYAELLKQHNDKKMSDIYGPIHLLRLFVKLRDMVSCTKVDSNSLLVLESLVSEFLRFIHENRKRYLNLRHYTVATAEYQRRAMC